MPHRIHIQVAGLLLSALILIPLAGCGNQKQDAAGTAPPVSSAEAPPAQEEPSFEAESPASPEDAPAEEVLPPETEANTPLPISAPEEIQCELYNAICSVRQPAPMEISGVTLSADPEIDVKKLYYELMRLYPELKYAYDISAAAENSVLTCQIAYMPYKTGHWPEAEGALTISSLRELLQAAEAHLGAEPLPIRLTDPALAPDDMNRILQQAGGGYILCALNRDGTAITYTPAMGMEMAECLSLLEQADQLAEQIIAQEVTASMTEQEKALALYAYLISHAKYDQRYYSDRKSMPYDAQTAIGALRDGLAICGGYSHALKLLFKKAEIPCFNVTGKYFSENHMWSIAHLDGEWLWFDATSDRGGSPAFGLRHFALEELDTTQYQWEQEQVDLFLQEVFAK